MPPDSPSRGWDATSVPPSIHVLVPLPSEPDSWLLALSDLDGRPVVGHALRSLARLGLPIRVTAEPAAAVSMREVVDTATVPGVELVEAAAGGWQSLADQAGLGAEQVAGRVPKPAVVLVHDPLCPLAPAHYLAELAGRAACEAAARSLVAVRPMTDTVKVRRGDRVTGTVDRSRLRVLSTPVSVPQSIAERVPAIGGSVDTAELVGRLRAAGEVELVEAPPLARRVAHPTDLQVVLSLRDLTAREGAPADR